MLTEFVAASVVVAARENQVTPARAAAAVTVGVEGQPG
jgi:hypothetical protein